MRSDATQLGGGKLFKVKIFIGKLFKVKIFIGCFKRKKKPGFFNFFLVGGFSMDVFFVGNLYFTKLGVYKLGGFNINYSSSHRHGSEKMGILEDELLVSKGGHFALPGLLENE